MLFIINLAKLIKYEWRDNIIDSFIKEDTAGYIWEDKYVESWKMWCIQ